jgi:hypothetical protein
MGKLYDVLGIWKDEGVKVTCIGLTPPASHSLQEISPQETLTVLRSFLAG